MPKTKSKDFFVHPTAIVEENVQIGEGSKIWHFSQIRTGSQIGKNCIIAKAVFVDIDSQIGNNVKIQNHAIIYHQAIIEDGVFIGPNVCFTNDKIPRSINADGTLKANADWEASTIKVGRGASIGGGAVILPGIAIGQFAMVGAGAVVTKDVPDFALVYGNPAKIQGFVCQCGKRLKKVIWQNRNRIIYLCACGQKISVSPYDKAVETFWKIKTPSSQNIATVLSWPPSYYEERLKKIGFVGKNSRLLDAGCGAGHWAIAASHLNREVKAIDSTERHLEVAQEISRQFQRPNLELTLGKMENLPYADKYFDFVISYCVWMYTNRPKSLGEMFRVLKPGGKLYLGSIASWGWHLQLIIDGLRQGNRSLIFTSLSAMRRRIPVSEQETRNLLSMQGFKILALGADGKIGDGRIAVAPVYQPRHFGLWNVYEVLAEKIQNSKSK